MLGIWIQQSEGAKFWLGVMNELNHRGLKDILVAVIDGLKGFPEAISAVYPYSCKSDLHRPSDSEFALLL